MDKPERAFYFPTFDSKPEIQSEVSKLWLPYGLDVEIRSPVATDDNYEEWLEEAGANIDELSRETDVDLIGASNGGKTALSLLTRHPNSIRRIVIINTKIGPYDFNNPATRMKLPNLAITSDILEKDQEKMTAEMRYRTLSLRSKEDDVLDDPQDAELEGGNNVVLPTDTHAGGIEFALAYCGIDIARFCIKGIVPNSV